MIIVRILVFILILVLTSVPVSAQGVRVKALGPASPLASNCQSYGPMKVTMVDLDVEVNTEVYNIWMTGGPFEGVSIAVDGDPVAKGVVDMFREACAAGLDVYACWEGVELMWVSYDAPSP